MNDDIYTRPSDYDLEHEHDQQEIAFYLELIRRWKPRRVLDLACGSGRLTIPLAQLGVDHDFHVTGVDAAEDMLARARAKVRDGDPRIAQSIRFIQSDIREFSDDGERYDVVLSTGSSIAHLLTLDDQLAVWRHARAQLREGGRFVVDVTMPNFRSFAASLQQPPRVLLEVDLDSAAAHDDRRLVRYKATMFDAYTQRASIRFFYDRFEGPQQPDRFLSDFESHVYFPQELRLLFLHTGFEIENTWADFAFRPPRSWSRDLIMAGRRAAAV